MLLRSGHVYEYENENKNENEANPPPYETCIICHGEDEYVKPIQDILTVTWDNHCLMFDCLCNYSTHRMCMETWFTNKLIQNVENGDENIEEMNENHVACVICSRPFDKVPINIIDILDCDNFVKKRRQFIEERMQTEKIKKQILEVMDNFQREFQQAVVQENTSDKKEMNALVKNTSMIFIFATVYLGTYYSILYWFS
ncbi:MAG: hypothetical protein EBS86_09555 [Crocinitomicaceae bacterium]|nr:hypothetical protein [Crocinitomicaceae bacterium]